LISSTPARFSFYESVPVWRFPDLFSFVRRGSSMAGPHLRSRPSWRRAPPPDTAPSSTAVPSHGPAPLVPCRSRAGLHAGAAGRRQPCCARAGPPAFPRLRPAVAWRRRAAARRCWPARPGPRPSLSLRASSSMIVMATFVKLEKTKVEDALIYRITIDR
jgi:hypothetical protein